MGIAFSDCFSNFRFDFLNIFTSAEQSLSKISCISANYVKSLHIYTKNRISEEPWKYISLLEQKFLFQHNSEMTFKQ